MNSRYGNIERERESRGGGLTKASLWWRDLSRLFWGSNGEGLRREFIRKVGNGENTLFWEDFWVEGECLKEKFSRLFRINTQNSAKISEMGDWANGGWLWDLQ